MNFIYINKFGVEKQKAQRFSSIDAFLISSGRCERLIARLLLDHVSPLALQTRHAADLSLVVPMLATLAYAIAKVNDESKTEPNSKANERVHAQSSYEKHVDKDGRHLQKGREGQLKSGDALVFGL